MSVDKSDTDETTVEVLDEEGSVDQKLKNRIIKAREHVDEAEQALFVKAVIKEDLDISHTQQVGSWAVIVRQYVRAVKPLLTNDEIDGADRYWREKELFKQEFLPPDKNEEWSLFANPRVDNAKLKRDMGLRPEFEPPQPKTFEITGLQDILDKQAIKLYWEFDKNRGQNIAKPDMERLGIEQPIPKVVYEEAVEATDEFLQQAGVGLELGTSGMEEMDL